MSYHNWLNWHEWPYRCIAEHIVTKQDTIIDVGAGCGFLGFYLLLENKCDNIIAYDTREEMRLFMGDLSKSLGLQNRFDIKEQFFKSDGAFTVSCRLGFSNLLLDNDGPTITLARTEECTPLFEYLTIPDRWNEKQVTRHDGFQLRVLWNYQD